MRKERAKNIYKFSNMSRLLEGILFLGIIVSCNLSSTSAVSISSRSLVVSILFLNFRDILATSSLPPGTKDYDLLKREDFESVLSTVDKRNPENVELELIMSDDGGGDSQENSRYRYNDQKEPQDKIGNDSGDILSVILKAINEDSGKPVPYRTSLDNQERSSVAKEDVESSVSSSGKSLLRNAKNRSWGSHPLPPLDAFVSTGGSWVAYFHDQAISVVQHKDDGTVLNCTLQEVIEPWEQRAGQEYLGQVMPLVPTSLPVMVHLVTLCGTLNRHHHHHPPPGVHSQASRKEIPWWLGLSALRGILPGTLWCGKRDQAVYYHQLGAKEELDACCRAHDHCPVKVLSLAIRYGYSNFGIGTKSHCLCDLEFFRCLKAVEDPLATTVGQLYFNLLQIQCLTPASPHSRVSQRNPPRPKGGIHPTYSSLKLRDGEPRSSFRSEETAVQAKKSESPADGSTQGVLVSSHGNPGGSQTRPEPETMLRDDPSVSADGDKYIDTSSDVTGRLECVRFEKDGSCRLWLLNPKGHTVRLTARSTNLRF